MGYLRRKRNNTNLQKLTDKLEELQVKQVEKEHTEQQKPAKKELDIDDSPGKGLNSKKIKYIMTKLLLTR